MWLKFASQARPETIRRRPGIALAAVFVGLACSCAEGRPENPTDEALPWAPTAVSTNNSVSWTSTAASTDNPVTTTATAVSTDSPAISAVTASLAVQSTATTATDAPEEAYLGTAEAAPTEAVVSGSTVVWPGDDAALCGIANVAWTEPSKLLRSAQPPLSAFACLREQGVDVVLNQRPLHEADPGEPHAVRSAGMEYIDLGIPDDTAPSPEMLKAWLTIVNARLAEGKVVLVHDAGGRGRIGFWEAVYLMQHGMSAEQAVEGRYLAKALVFGGAKIGCADGGHGQVQALNEIGVVLNVGDYVPQIDEYGHIWTDCPRPDYMNGWDYSRVLARDLRP